MRNLKGIAFFDLVDKSKNKYELHIIVKGFQDQESVRLFKRSGKRLCFCEGFLFLIAGGVVVTLMPEDSENVYNSLSFRYPVQEEPMQLDDY